MTSPAARPPRPLQPTARLRPDRAETVPETIVTRLPLQPPAKTPRPLLLRPLRCPARRPEAADEAGGGAAPATAPRRPFADAPRVAGSTAAPPTPAPARAGTPVPVERSAPAPSADFDDTSVPNLRPAPRYGLVLALIGAAALAIGAAIATVVHRVELDLPAADAPAVSELPPQAPAPVVISDLPEAEPNTGR